MHHHIIKIAIFHNKLKDVFQDRFRNLISEKNLLTNHEALGQLNNREICAARKVFIRLVKASERQQVYC